MSLQEELIEALEQTFGPWEKLTSKFGSTSFGEIADQLCLSNSLFTKLISGTATEGMYIRCIKNINRIQRNNEINEENKGLKLTLDHYSSEKSQLKRYMLFLGIISLGLLALFCIKLFNDDVAKNSAQMNKEKDELHFLASYFDQTFGVPHISPFIPRSEVQKFCPCSAFEGKWELAKPYYIPIPFNKPGIYYIAKSSDVRIKCAQSLNNLEDGFEMIGFEKMTHEFWIDKTHEPLVPKYFNPDTKQFTKAYFNINFEENENFEKIAEISAFMLNKLTFSDERIYRIAEPVGRYARKVNEVASQKHEIDVDDLLEDVVGNMVKTECSDTENLFCNPNSLIEGESIIDFNCNFPIFAENLGFGGSYPYTKGFKLIEQNYSDNLLCDCKGISSYGEN